MAAVASPVPESAMITGHLPRPRKPLFNIVRFTSQICLGAMGSGCLVDAAVKQQHNTDCLIQSISTICQIATLERCGTRGPVAEDPAKCQSRLARNAHGPGHGLRGRDESVRTTAAKHLVYNETSLYSRSAQHAWAERHRPRPARLPSKRSRSAQGMTSIQPRRHANWRPVR